MELVSCWYYIHMAATFHLTFIIGGEVGVQACFQKLLYFLHGATVYAVYKFLLIGLRRRQKERIERMESF